jgi:hypothetical protein
MPAKTRQQIRKQEELDQEQIKQEFQQSKTIAIDQTDTLEQQQQHILYRPNSLIMSEKLINTILSNSVDILPKFAGENNDNVNKWLTDITKELNSLKLTDQQKLSRIQTLLIDDARRWFMNNMSSMTDWHTFAIQIQKTFSSPLHQELPLRKVGTRQQGLDETVLHYYNDMIELFDMIDIKMSDQYKVAYLKAGLRPSLKKRDDAKRSTNINTVFGISTNRREIEIIVELTN